MDLTIHQSRLINFRYQRNTLAGLCVVMMVLNALQGLYILMRQERVIITPPQVTQSFWVEGNRFSPQYLEEMALHYIHFILDVTDKNILYQGEVLLRYVTPEAYGTFKSKLLEDEKILKKNNLSTRFYAAESKISSDTLTVKITGDLMTYVGDKRISSVRETYQFRFIGKSGRLLIEEFKLLKSEKNPKEETE